MEKQDLLGDKKDRYIYCIFQLRASEIQKFVGGIEASSIGSAITKNM